MAKNIESQVPKVSVLMPIFNAEKYLENAIESVLDQTYKEFELILINDGSTDNSPRIIDKYAKKDKRINLISHENRGYAAALNEGLGIARGKYIARMDADDISESTRLSKQINYLEEYENCTALFTKVQLITALGDPIADWEADTIATSVDEIRRIMPVENCCAHPSLMIRSEALKKFMYDEAQVPSEDYDLWLRLLSSGYELHKINEKLLQYRIHGDSVTQTSNKNNSAQKKYIHVKQRFLYKQIVGFKFGDIEMDVLKSYLVLLFSVAKSTLGGRIRKIIPATARSHMRRTFFRFVGFKLRSSQFFRHIKAQTHIRLNRAILEVFLIRRGLVGKPQSDILVVVPWMKVGGAEKIVLDLITGLKDRGYFISCISTVAGDNSWSEAYAKTCNEVIDLGNIAVEENKDWFVSKYVSSLGIRHVFTTNNFAGYRAAKKIKMTNPKIKVIDILHGQGGGKEGGGWPYLSLDYDKYLDYRVTVTGYLKKYMVKKYGLNAARIRVIHNGIAIPSEKIPEASAEVIKKDKFIVLWAGRFSYEKHPELAIKTAELVSKKYKDIHFVVVGDGEMKPDLMMLVSNLKLSDSVTIADKPYRDSRSYMCYSDVLLMSSEMEGLPLVILEAMVSKLPVIAPRVGGIPEEVSDGKSGFVIAYSPAFHERAAEKIIYLYKNTKRAKEMGAHGHEIVSKDFSMQSMVDKYIELLKI